MVQLTLQLVRQYLVTVYCELEHKENCVEVKSFQRTKGILEETRYKQSLNNDTR